MNTVCMATYNGAKYLRAQLESILSQLHPDDELIISDDHSTDATRELVRSYSDPRIRLLTNTSSRKGCIGNFQHALRHARGEYIFLADQDDVWLPQKYETVCSLLREYAVVVHDSIVTDADLTPVQNSFFQTFGSGRGILKNLIRSSYYGSCMAFSKELLTYALPFPETEEIGHDLWIGLVGELKASVVFYPEPLLLYRRHAETTTALGVELHTSSRPLWKKLRGRFIMLRELCKFLFR